MQECAKVHRLQLTSTEICKTVIQMCECACWETFWFLMDCSLLLGGGVSQRICARWRGRSQSYLETLGSRMRARLGEMAD